MIEQSYLTQVAVRTIELKPCFSDNRPLGALNIFAEKSPAGPRSQLERLPSRPRHATDPKLRARHSRAIQTA